jgi:hypothetical protein
VGAFISSLTRPVVLLALLCACATTTPGLATTSPPGPCHAGKPEAGVYQPDRLQVLDPCAHVEGIIVSVIPEPDGDYHVWINVDEQYRRLLNTENHFQGRPALLAEITPDCPLNTNPPNASSAAQCPKSEIPVPKQSERIAIDGPWVLDTNHGWNEIHPVDTLKVVADG